ncbi:MAG: DUF1292 domain-containing protein [Ruminococcus sp.]
MSDSDMTNSCSSCGSSSSCGGSDCSTCSGCSTDANQHSTITLTMEDDTEVECAILTIFPGRCQRNILRFFTLDEEGQNHDGEVYLYSFTRTAEGAPMLSNIESDEEYNKAAIAFDTVLQNAREAEAAGTPLGSNLSGGL